MRRPSRTNSGSPNRSRSRPSAWLIAGWVTTEVGRQPWTVYGLLRTVDSVSPIGAAAVGASLLSFIVVYFTVFGTGVFYILRLMSKAPDAGIDDNSGSTRISSALCWITLAVILSARMGGGKQYSFCR